MWLWLWGYGEGRDVSVDDVIYKVNFEMPGELMASRLCLQQDMKRFF